MDTTKPNTFVDEIPATLRQPFAGINLLGLFSENKFKKLLLTAVYTIVFTIHLVIVLLQFTNIKKEVSQYVNNLETVFGILQVSGKIICVAHRQKDFIRLIDKTKQFWSVNDCSNSTKAEVNLICSLIFRLQRFFFVGLIISLIFAFLSTFVGNKLPAGIWTLEGHNTLYYITFVIAQLTVAESALFSYYCDCLFLGFCAEVVIQFKILSCHLEDLTVGGISIEEKEMNYNNKMRRYFYHHNFLLTFINEFQEVYSKLMLIQYITVGPLVCLEIYAASESSVPQVIVRHAVLAVIFTVQLVFYCVPANYLAYEAMSISKAVYFSNWYSYYFPSLTKPVLLMIQNSQREIKITAGGIVIMDARTVLNVLKVAWSACTIMKSVK